MKRFLWVAASIAFGVGLALALPSAVASAPHNRLTLGSVTPSAGTTSTTFAFSVTFGGVSGNTASSVTATVAGQAVPLALVPPGTAAKGTWRGSSRLPAGSWPVTFEATASGTTPQLDLPQPVVVTGPGPTPRPTPRPIVVPTAAPTLAPRPTPSPAPGGSDGAALDPTPFGTTFLDASDLASPTASAGGASPSAGEFPHPAPSGAGLPLEGIAAVGLLAVVAFAAISAERRRRQTGASEAGDGTPSERAAAPRDEDHLATIDYLPPDEPPDKPGG